MSGLRPEQRELLTAAVVRHAAPAERYLSAVGVTPLTAEAKDALRGALVAELLEAGLDEHDEHTARGRDIEDILDVLSHL